MMMTPFLVPTRSAILPLLSGVDIVSSPISSGCAYWAQLDMEPMCASMSLEAIFRMTVARGR